MMPKSKNNRKGKSRDRRPVPRSGKNEGRVDYRTAKPVGDVTEPKQCKYLDRVATLPNLFTPDECQQIINTALNDWDQRESMIQRDEGNEIKQNFKEDFDYRNTTLFIPKGRDEWLFNKIMGAILGFNNSESGYNFDVRGLAEPPNVMRYQAPDINPNGKPGKYDWHMDVGPGPVPSMRKISYSILLNPTEYEGGELCFHIGRNTDPHGDQHMESMIGSMLLFPSYMVHRVLPMTKGTRYAVVGWAHGSSFS
tara:strand:- start:221 stop:976 length:756 start_codon:yes stop_codon:yes gene_type:complete